MGVIERLEIYLEEKKRSSIRLNIDGNVDFPFCVSRFGGAPDVPRDFEWPRYKDFDFEGELKTRPLSFLAQINCEEATRFDKDGLLPDHGILSFFYELSSEPWGYSSDERGCARVFWFEDTSELVSAVLPHDLDDKFIFPAIKIDMSEIPSVPSFQDMGDIIEEVEFEVIYNAKMDIGINELDNVSKLLGYADTIQDSIGVVCELVSRGYNIEEGWPYVPIEDIEEAEEIALDKWKLLFQLDTIILKDFELIFGDMGRLYFYITEDDLKERRFENAWCVVQSY